MATSAETVPPDPPNGLDPTTETEAKTLGMYDDKALTRRLTGKRQLNSLIE